MEKDVFDIIASKEHSQLTKEELELVNEVCVGEDEFLQMKKVLSEVSRMAKNEQVEPSPNVKSKLDDLFMAQSFPKATPVWYNKVGLLLYPRDKKFFQRPLVRIAAVLILFLSILPFILQNEIGPKTTQMAKNEVSKMEKSEEAIRNDEKNGNETPEVMTNSPEIQTRNEVVRSSEPHFSLLEDAVAESFSAESSDEMSAKSLAFDHPDGVFAGAVSSQIELNSIPVSEQPDVLDLLTASF